MLIDTITGWSVPAWSHKRQGDNWTIPLALLVSMQRNLPSGIVSRPSLQTHLSKLDGTTKRENDKENAPMRREREGEVWICNCTGRMGEFIF